MTPERICFHLLMLEAGDGSRYAEELNAALEAENPLPDLTLALSLAKDAEECCHVMREYLMDYPADMNEVERQVRAELKR